MEHVSAGCRWSLGGQGTFCKPCIASSRCPTSSPWPTKVGTPIASKRYFILASWYKWLHHHKTIWRWGDYVKSPTLKLAWRRLLIYTVYIRIKRRARTWGSGKSQFHLPSWFFPLIACHDKKITSCCHEFPNLKWFGNPRIQKHLIYGWFEYVFQGGHPLKCPGFVKSHMKARSKPQCQDTSPAIQSVVYEPS